MAQSRRRSGAFQGEPCCFGSIRRPRMGGISHQRTGASAWPWFVEYAGSLAFIRLEMARALRQFLRAPDYREACGVVVRNPILLLESAPELLRATVEEAERRGDRADRDMLLSYLHVLELARETSIVSVSGDTSQPN